MKYNNKFYEKINYKIHLQLISISGWDNKSWIISIFSSSVAICNGVWLIFNIKYHKLIN